MLKQECVVVTTSVMVTAKSVATTHARCDARIQKRWEW
jgi:hypothetical protein